ncbi:hypothetical protein CPT03_02235 [Pedobacter ginsengisoli]|uniref:Uncharacterized protein n=1 Tax=Pedobacter ginsengisoli TaxID=363852 RepID=A0A2D1U1H8_9SPHI|nr:hypothetical protein CPT03_02235 [Pedobacter ginsengisoli]
MKKSLKILRFTKEDVADLTKEEQQRLVGGVAPTVTKCTETCTDVTYGAANCTDGCTGGCQSVYGGADCDPASGLGNATCYISAVDRCHTDFNCTKTQCTATCPNTYGDPTCKDC